MMQLGLKLEKTLWHMERLIRPSKNFRLRNSALLIKFISPYVEKLGLF